MGNASAKAVELMKGCACKDSILEDASEANNTRVCIMPCETPCETTRSGLKGSVWMKLCSICCVCAQRIRIQSYSMTYRISLQPGGPPLLRYAARSNAKYPCLIPYLSIRTIHLILHYIKLSGVTSYVRLPIHP